MLQSDGKREDLERINSSKLSSAELEVIFSRMDCCSSEQCMKKIIASCSGVHNRASDSTNHNRSLSGSATYYCQQIGIPNHSSLFDLYVTEIRKPFQEYVFGTDCQMEGNKQLRHYLVNKFLESRIQSGIHNKSTK